MRVLRVAVITWIVLYPVLPPGPIIAFLIASALGPPFVLGYDAAGWPVLGPVTPAFVAWTVGLPWAVSTAALLVLLRTRHC